MAGGQRQRRARKRSLAIVEKAFRGSIEEQYGHIVRLSEVLRATRAEHNLLLRGNAVVFATRAQPRLTLTVGATREVPLSHYESSLQGLHAAGAEIYVYRPDAVRLGLQGRLVPEVRLLDGAALVELCEAHDYVWYW